MGQNTKCPHPRQRPVRAPCAPREATVQLAPGIRKPKENLTFRPSWLSGRPGTAPGLPRSSKGPAKGRHGAPRACRGARHDLARPALGRSRPAEELRKACPGPPQSAQALPRSSPEPGKACPGTPQACRGAPEGLPKAAADDLPRSSRGRELYAWTARRCHKAAAASRSSTLRHQTMPKKRPNMLESTLDVHAQCFVPWRRREAELDSSIDQ